MTTIIGLQGDGWAVIGTDSLISSFDDQGFITGQSKLPADTSKIVNKDGFILGAAGDVRAINLLHHVLQVPTTRYATTTEKLNQYVTKRFIPALRECFDEHGFSAPEKGDRDHRAEHGSTIILSVNAHVYVIESDYSWASDASGIYVIGTGSPYAKGAIHVLTNGLGAGSLTQKKAISVVEKALEVACSYDPYSAPPFYIYTQVEG